MNRHRKCRRRLSPGIRINHRENNPAEAVPISVMCSVSPDLSGAGLGRFCLSPTDREHFTRPSTLAPSKYQKSSLRRVPQQAQATVNPHAEDQLLPPTQTKEAQRSFELRRNAIARLRSADNCKTALALIPFPSLSGKQCRRPSHKYQRASGREKLWEGRRSLAEHPPR